MYTGSEITYETAADAVSPYYTISSGSLADGQSITAITLSGTGTYVGEYPITIDQASVKIGDYTANYTITVKPGKLTITDENVPDDKVVKKSDGADNDGKLYHVGDTVTWEIWVKNIYNEEKTLTVTEGMANITLSPDPLPTTLTAGQELTITATYVITADDIDNTSDQPKEITNTVTVKLGDLEKTGDDTIKTEPIEITITAGSDSKVYDGEALTKNTWEKTAGELATGDAIESVTVTGSQTLVGTSANVPSAAVIKNAADEDVTDGYKITYANGTLEVKDGTDPGDPDVPDDKVVTKTSVAGTYHVGDTITWTIWVKNIYDAEKTLTVTDTLGNVTLNPATLPDKLSAGEELTITATYVVTAADVVAGNVTNHVDVKLGDLEKAGDDTVKTEPIAITITAASQTRQFNGAALTNNGYTLTAGTLATGHKIASVTVTGSQTNVGSSANVPSAAVIRNAANEDVTKGYKITYVNGTLTITAPPAEPVWARVTYTDGVPGEVVFPDQVTNTGIQVGDPTPAFTGNLAREGYTFAGWAPAVSPTITQVVTVYTAQWTEVPPADEPPADEPEPPADDNQGGGEPEEIIDEEPPLANFSAWALLNLIASIGTVATAAGMAITFFKKKEDEDDDVVKVKADGEPAEDKGKKSKFFGLIPAVASVVIFFLTENMHDPMVLVDKWTIPMFGILLVNGILAYFTRNKKPEEPNADAAEA